MMYIDFIKNKYPDIPDIDRQAYIDRDKKALISIVQEKITQNAEEIVERWYKLSDIGFLPQEEKFLDLLKEAEQLYSFGFYTGTIAVVGIACEEYCRYLVAKHKLADVKTQEKRIDKLYQDGVITNDIKRMLNIKPNDIKFVMSQMSGKSESLFKNTYQLLNQVFNSAVENRDILVNPCPKIKMGGIPQKDRLALTDDQVAVLLDAIKGTKAYVFCMIALYAGLRREEILGLQWDCVCLDEPPHISVRRALRFEHNRPVVTEKLKTRASKRTVSIPHQLVECLKEHKASSSSDYVICNSTGGPLSGTQFKGLWNAVACRKVGTRTSVKYVNGEKITRTIEALKGEKARGNSHYYLIDFDVTPHILRHTYITNLLLAGVDIKTVQYLAGHEQSRITLDIYAHLTYNRPEDILPKILMAFGSDEKGGLSNGREKEAQV